MFPVIPIAAIVRGNIMRKFRNAGALSAATAKTSEELDLRTGLGLDLSKSLIFKRLVQRGHIIETDGGKYYMDQAYCEALFRRIKFVIPVMLAVIALLAILISFLTK